MGVENTSPCVVSPWAGCGSDEVPFPGGECRKFGDCYEAARAFLASNLPSWDLTNKVQRQWISAALFWIIGDYNANQ